MSAGFAEESMRAGSRRRSPARAVLTRMNSVELHLFIDNPNQGSNNIIGPNLNLSCTSGFRRKDPRDANDE